MKKIILIVAILCALLCSCSKNPPDFCYGDSLGKIVSLDMKMGAFNSSDYLIINLDSGDQYVLPSAGRIHSTNEFLFYDKDCSPHYYISTDRER